MASAWHNLTLHPHTPTSHIFPVSLKEETLDVVGASCDVHSRANGLRVMILAPLSYSRGSVVEYIPNGVCQIFGYSRYKGYFRKVTLSLNIKHDPDDVKQARGNEWPSISHFPHRISEYLVI